ncbi:microtubule-associated protein 6 homolog isoform X1 [Pygocentrus nattereri]|uniref:Microtubule-associated protein 6a n=1 Tax=Pygocentrus nattereri TaxID=42514 RepID=A0A3B4E284_PYGNA|nr:microtubule-associated protein 6 homolog isoform X1 [Pygocentrus nattereri]
MAWPCIARACCMARFWSQLDKADIAVPLVFVKYSEASEETQQLQKDRERERERDRERNRERDREKDRTRDRTRDRLQERSQERDQERDRARQEVTRDGREEAAGSVMRQDFKAWKVRPEPSCKPKSEYHNPEVPFDSQTQYRQDYKPWPLPRKGDHPWIPKPAPESGLEKSQTADKVQEKEMLVGERKKRQAKRVEKENKVTTGKEGSGEAPVSVGKGREAVDALNRQIKEEVTAGSSYRTEFKAYTDVKPVKLIRAKSQYHPPDEKTNLETSYSATFRGEQAKLQPADNKALERRRIRSLYSEPYMEPSKVDRTSVPRSKPKKAASSSTSQGKAVKKSKEKQAASARGSKKKSSENQPERRPAQGDKEKSKEMNNKLAEAKEVVLKQYHYIQLCQPIRDIGWVQTLKQHLWRCALPDPRESESAVGRVSDYYSPGTSGRESEPLVERPEPRSKAVVRFAPDVKY